MEEYDLKKTILLHDKYEAIDGEMKKNGIRTTVDPEYTKISFGDRVELTLKTDKETVVGTWKISIRDLLGEAVVFLGLILWMNAGILYQWIRGTPIVYAWKENVELIVFTALLLILLMARLATIPFTRKRRILKMDRIREILHEKGII